MKCSRKLGFLHYPSRTNQARNRATSVCSEDWQNERLELAGMSCPAPPHSLRSEATHSLARLLRPFVVTLYVYTFNGVRSTSCTSLWHQSWFWPSATNCWPCGFDSI